MLHKLRIVETNDHQQMIISTLLGQVTLFQDFDWPKSLSHIETLWLLIE